MLQLDTNFKKIITLLFISVLLSACGGGGSSSPDAGGSQSPISGGNNPPAAPGTRDLGLSWVAPSTRTDGTPISLSDIGGYKLYVGTSSGSYDPAIDVGNTTTYTLSSKGPGTYFLAISAYDLNTQESSLSNEMSITIN
ncbi:MAG TPA: hypothetical protein ENI64_08760 [Gammaproteobacteria bacterium]|nr:hypothetical protein [Gammaproteobacteria bacterium]